MSPYRTPLTPDQLAPHWEWLPRALLALPFTWRWRWARRAIGGHWEECHHWPYAVGGGFYAWRRVHQCRPGARLPAPTYRVLRCEDWR